MAVQFDSAAVSLFSGGAAPKTAQANVASAFTSALQSAMSSVDSSAGAANTAVSDMVAGTGDVHDAMIALQKAETTLQLTMQVRNKLMAAYQDIMRMPV